MVFITRVYTRTIRAPTLPPFWLSSPVILASPCLAQNYHTRRPQQSERTRRTLSPRDRRIDQLWTWMAQERREKRKLREAALQAQNQSLLHRWFIRPLE